MRKFNSWGLMMLLALQFCYMASYGQLSTQNNYTGTWSDVSSWSTAQPDPLTTGIDEHQNIDVYGYITRKGDLSFANIGSNSFLFTIYDTLIVEGNLSFDANSMSLQVESGGILVVFGNFSAANKVNLNNGGTVVVLGDMSLTGGNQEYTDNGGGLFVEGAITGNGDVTEASSVDQPLSNLDSSQPALYDFIIGGGTTPLPITLSFFQTEFDGESVQLTWETLSEENFSHFEIQKSLDGESFEVIAEVSAKGNLDGATTYSFIDRSLSTEVLYYRLNAVDFDGTSELFQTKSVQIVGLEGGFQVYPNPMNSDYLTIVNQSSDESFLRIFDMRGNEVYAQAIEQKSLEIQGLNLQTGMYFVTIESNQKVVQQKLLVR